MIPLRVHAENFATYPTLDWDIPPGLVAILGRNAVTDGSDSNGAGKSTLLESISVALFGGLPEYLTAGEEACSVELKFEHGGETYRVRRTYSAKGRGRSTLDLERWENDGNE